MAGLDELFADALVAGLAAVRRGGRHDKTCAAGIVQIGVKVGNPEVVGISDFLVFVDAGQTEGQTPRAACGFRLDFIDIERRVGHDIIALPAEVMRVVIKGVGFVAGADDAGKTVNRHVHQAELGVVRRFFLTVEGHGVVGDHTRAVDEIAGLDKHAAAAACGIEQYAGGRLDHIDDHLDQRFGREKYAVVGCDGLREFIEEIFVDAADDVAAHVIERVVVEDAQKLRQQRIGEDGVVLGQYADELFALLLDELHRVVDDLAQTVHDMPLDVGQVLSGDIRRQADEVAVLRVLRQEKCAFFREVAGLDGQWATVARGAAFEKLGFDHLKSAVRIAQKNQTQNRHTVLIAGQRRTGAQQIGRGPEIVFEFLNIEPIGHGMSPRRIFQSV